MSEPTPLMQTPPQSWKSAPDYSTRSAAIRETGRKCGLSEEQIERAVQHVQQLQGYDEPEPPKKEFNFLAHFAKSVWIFNIAGGAILIALFTWFLLNQPSAAEVTPDQSYITQVRAGTTKLGSIDDTDLISLGHKACNARKQGMSQEQTLLNVMSSAQDRTLRNDLAYTIGAAYAAYCPEYTR